MSYRGGGGSSLPEIDKNVYLHARPESHISLGFVNVFDQETSQREDDREEADTYVRPPVEVVALKEASRTIREEVNEGVGQHGGQNASSDR